MIQHVALEVPTARLDACRSFYGLLGFTEVPAPGTLAERAVWLERGGTQVHLLYSDPGPAEARVGHFAVVVDPYDARVAALSEAGHEPEARQEHWGSPRAYVRDPAGNLVELMAFAPSRPGPPPATP